MEFLCQGLAFVSSNESLCSSFVAFHRLCSVNMRASFQKWQLKRPQSDKNENWKHIKRYHPESAFYLYMNHRSKVALSPKMIAHETVKNRSGLQDLRSSKHSHPTVCPYVPFGFAVPKGVAATEILDRGMPATQLPFRRISSGFLLA